MYNLSLMDSGYYWYQSVKGDPEDFTPGEWEILKVALLVQRFSDDFVYDPNELHGRFVGPIAAPF
jgi:hypothetical protein